MTVEIGNPAGAAARLVLVVRAVDTVALAPRSDSEGRTSPRETAGEDADVATALAPQSRARPSAIGVTGHTVGGLWFALAVIGRLYGTQLDLIWPYWRTGFWALGVWGLNAALLSRVVGPRITLSRLPVLSVGFALLMTVLGTASYAETRRLFPTYSVFIERAALFVAICTAASLIGYRLVGGRSNQNVMVRSQRMYWDWHRLKVATYAMFFVSLCGLTVSIHKIGYLPILSGDPGSQRVAFPAIAGMWYRLSMLGVAASLLAGAQCCAHRGRAGAWIVVIGSLLGVSVYGNRFFAALPAGALILLWDRVRRPIRIGAIMAAFLVGVPTLAFLYFWRQQTQGLEGGILGPLGLILYGTLGEFRDLGWTLDYYASGVHPLLHGATLGGLVVPLLPGPVWAVLGVDKAAVFANSNAAILAQVMGRVPAQRVGLYGELFMNFGWPGAVAGAFIYGCLIAYLDRLFLSVRSPAEVRGVILAVIIAAAVYAQVGQWNMFTSAVAAFCYPILLVAVVAGKQVRGVGLGGAGHVDT